MTLVRCQYCGHREEVEGDGCCYRCSKCRRLNTSLRGGSLDTFAYEDRQVVGSTNWSDGGGGWNNSGSS